MFDPGWMVWIGSGAAVGVAGGVSAVYASRRKRLASAGRLAREEAERTRLQAAADARRIALEAEIAARQEALARREAIDEELRLREADAARLDAEAVARAIAVEGKLADVGVVQAALAERARGVAEREAERRGLAEQARALMRDVRVTLERTGAVSASSLQQMLQEVEVDQARAHAAQLLRQIDQTVADPEHVRRAKRVMGISAGRFSGHYLTERHQSVVFLGEPREGNPLVSVDCLAAIGAVAGVTLTLSDGLDAVRLEGLDGVGREVARRTLGRLLRRPVTRPQEAGQLAKEFGAQVDREVGELGRKAFATLQIHKSHPDIVRLVGRLNWRTSFTQNQWKHAVEVGFLCGLMAEEMGLDVKLARRAALMHDIGKALTHELDGSHAVIGADYARRLGEPEVVANAIGAHHTDEPFNSPYALLVAAADAMSGARPGARRQTEDNFVAKMADLERISRRFPGVEEAFAVQGGREIRVYVDELRVDDLGAIRLSSEIAESVSREMTFPGQIKVTVIREFRAVESAG